MISATKANVDMHLNMLRGAITGLGGSVEVMDVANGAAVLKYKVGGGRGGGGARARCVGLGLQGGREGGREGGRSTGAHGWPLARARAHGRAARAALAQGPDAIRKGVSAAIKDQFPEIKDVQFV